MKSALQSQRKSAVYFFFAPFSEKNQIPSDSPLAKEENQSLPLKKGNFMENMISWNYEQTL